MDDQLPIFSLRINKKGAEDNEFFSVKVIFFLFVKKL